jgi:segregation and condensation protein B
MTVEQLTLDIEALVFASDRALTLHEIHGVVNDMYVDSDMNLSEDQVRSALDTIQAKYDTAFHSFTLKEIGGGFQFLTKPEYHRAIAKLNGDKFMKRLSTAAMETLAIIAYKQPITKGDIEYIRGVSCDYSIQKLLEKELIVISGRNEEAVGKPLLYNSSKNFMDYLGLNNLDDLPKLSEIVPNEIVVPTAAEFAFPDMNIGTNLVVDEGGALQEVEASNDEAASSQDETSKQEELSGSNADVVTAADQSANESNEESAVEENELGEDDSADDTDDLDADGAKDKDSNNSDEDDSHNDGSDNDDKDSDDDDIDDDDSDDDSEDEQKPESN